MKDSRLENFAKRLKELPPFSQDFDNLSKAFDHFLKIVDEEMDEIEHAFPKQKDIPKQINKIIKVIKKSIDYYLKGQVEKCNQHLNSALKITRNDWENWIFRTETLYSNSIYYRMRANDSEYIFSAKEMFHVPFDQREKLGNQRFSLSGYPCLYLSSSLYCCWEELNRPAINNANVVALKSDESLILYDLTMPVRFELIDQILIIPFVISCSLKSSRENRVFKEEYIIPQTILQLIVDFNYSHFKPPHQEAPIINGIMYTSTRIGDKQNCAYDDHRLLQNYVFPTINASAKEGYCRNLSNAFSCTKPTSLNYDLITGAQHSYSPPTDEMASEGYFHTQLGRLQKSISSRDFIRFSVSTPHYKKPVKVRQK